MLWWIWTMCSKQIQHSKFNSQHNWKDTCDSLRRKFLIIFFSTLTTYEFCISTPNFDTQNTNDDESQFSNRMWHFTIPFNDQKCSSWLPYLCYVLDFERRTYPPPWMALGISDNYGLIHGGYCLLIRLVGTLCSHNALCPPMFRGFPHFGWCNGSQWCSHLGLFLYSKETNHRHLLIMEAELQTIQTTLFLVDEW